MKTSTCLEETKNDNNLAALSLHGGGVGGGKFLSEYRVSYTKIQPKCRDTYNYPVSLQSQILKQRVDS